MRVLDAQLPAPAEFDATSILSTMQKLYGIAPLTKRDEWSVASTSIRPLLWGGGDAVGAGDGNVGGPAHTALVELRAAAQREGAPLRAGAREADALDPQHRRRALPQQA